MGTRGRPKKNPNQEEEPVKKIDGRGQAKKKGGELSKDLQAYSVNNPECVPQAKHRESNIATLTFIVEVVELGKTCDHNDPENMADHFKQYLLLCKKYGMKVLNQSAYLSMGINRSTASKIRLGQLYKSDKRYHDVIELVDMVCASTRETLMAEGNINPIAGIWWQKNYDRMSEQAVSDKDGDSPFGEDNVSAAELAEKYKDVLDL